MATAPCELSTLESQIGCKTKCFSNKELLAALVWLLASVSYSQRGGTDYRTPDALGPVTDCFNCYSDKELFAMLIQIASTLGVDIAAFEDDPTADELSEALGPFLSWDEHKLKAAVVYLICQIVNSLTGPQ